jgi:hypothetical protein
MLITHGIAFKFEYLSEFEFIFEKNWGSESGEWKNTEVKNLVQEYLLGPNIHIRWWEQLRTELFTHNKDLQLTMLTRIFDC